MFSFFKKKPPALQESPPTSQADAAASGLEHPHSHGSSEAPADSTTAQPCSSLAEAQAPDAGGAFASGATPDAEAVPAVVAPATEAAPENVNRAAPAPPSAGFQPVQEAPIASILESADAAPTKAAAPARWWTPPWSPAAKAASAPLPVELPAAPEPAIAPEVPASPLSLPAVQAPTPTPTPEAPPIAVAATEPVTPAPVAQATAIEAPVPARRNWIEKLKVGLKKTGTSLATVFTGTRIDENLYEELEAALLMSDTGVKATEFLLTDLRRRVKESRATDPAAVKGLLADAITDLLKPLQKTLHVGDRPDNLHDGKHGPTVIMVAGVNGAGKTTSIGKLTSHLAQSGATVLLAAADTFRAAAREQLAVWATRNTVEIISQQGGDPAAVSFDAVSAGRARGRDVVLVDTAGRLPTQLHLMEELRKIRRVVQKADPTAPHEVLLVIDGNTGQNALAQVRAFDDALTLTGLIITKLDGTAKGGVLCAIAREKPVPVYFIGVGEKLEDLETFNAREFAQALLA